MKLLVVDDNPALRRWLQAQLKQAGHSVVEADGQSVWMALRREPVQAVLAEWSMQGLDGPELVRRLRSAQPTGAPYVILLKAASDARDPEVGADDILYRPFDTVELLTRIALAERVSSLEARLSEALALLDNLATHDSLTEVFNRRQFIQFAQRELDRARRYGRPASAILLDIDELGKVNAAHGLAAGDYVLRAVAGRCRKNIRDVDILGRVGGGQFAILLPEVGHSAASLVAERLRGLAAEPIAMAGRKLVHATVSLGIASLSASDANLEALLERAAIGLKAAKEAGGNRVGEPPPQ